MINAVSVMLGQQPGPPDAKTAGASDTVHTLFTKMGIARNKQKYQALLAELDAVVAAMAQLPAADVSYRDARASAVQRPLVRRTVEITQKVE